MEEEDSKKPTPVDSKAPKGIKHHHHEDEEPILKKSKVSNETVNYVAVEIRKDLVSDNFIGKFQSSWNEEKDLDDDAQNVKLKCYPFKLGVVQNFLQNSSILKPLVEEILNLDWSRKRMDLYEFYQSKDLSNLNSPLLAEFYSNLKNNVTPWMEKMCNIKLNGISASCSMYNSGDYLLVHDDLLSNRQIAFVFYISPWDNMQNWTDDMGGHLEIFEPSDIDQLPRFPIFDKISPRNNQFVFFKVSNHSFHQVGEVTALDYPRLTINGWFHGEKNECISNYVTNGITEIKFDPPINTDLDLNDWINETYLKENIKSDIQQYIEDSSEICLQQYLKEPIFNELKSDLVNNKNYTWTIKGPANVCHYQILNISIEQGPLNDFLNLLRSQTFFELLYDYTELDVAGEKANYPKCTLEVQKWNQKCYTVLADNSSYSEDCLDLIFFINACENAGTITYLSPEGDDEDDHNDESSVLLSITPKENALNLVYRSKGTTRFTKYVSNRAHLPDKEMYVIVCSYKE